MAAPAVDVTGPLIVMFPVLVRLVAVNATSPLEVRPADPMTSGLLAVNEVVPPETEMAPEVVTPPVLTTERLPLATLIP